MHPSWSKLKCSHYVCGVRQFRAQWSDLKAAEAVAHAAMTAIANFTAPTDSAVLGIGGTHYNQKFTQMALMGEAVFGHMIPKYAVPLVDSEMLSQCVEQTLEKVPLAFLIGKASKAKTNQTCCRPWRLLGCPSRKYKHVIY